MKNALWWIFGIILLIYLCVNFYILIGIIIGLIIFLVGAVIYYSIIDDKKKEIEPPTETQQQTDEMLEIDEYDEDENEAFFNSEYFEEAARLAVETQQTSVKLLERHFEIEQYEAEDLMDLLEKAGIINSWYKDEIVDVEIESQEDLDILLEELGIFADDDD
jgi:hypothetical protein